MERIRILNGVFASQGARVAYPVRFTLAKRQEMAMYLRRGKCTLHVIAGTAWIATNGQDLFVSSGESIDLQRDRNPIIIAALGMKQVTFEIRSDEGYYA